MGRAPCCDKANVKKGPWSPEEDAKLKDYIEEYGTGGNWIALPQKIGLRRCGKSCRLRWLNYLRPNLRHGGFSDEEDQIICSLYISIGSRWSIIAAQLPGRTDNDIKNYWNTKLKKKLLGRRREPSQSSINNQDPKDGEDIGSNRDPQPMSASALERIQLHMQLQGLHNPFSFYNNPALWPKFHPLGDMILQNKLTDPEQVSGAATIHNPIEPEIPNSMNTNMQDGFDNSTDSMSNETSNSNFRSVAVGTQAELHGLLSDQNGNFENDQITDLDCFNGMNGERGSTNWWASNSFDERSSLGSWALDSALQPDTMLQEYMLGYDL